MLVFRRIVAYLRALHQAAPVHSIVLIPFVLIEGLIPIAFVLSTGVLIGAIPDAVEGSLSSAPGRRLVVALVATASLYVARQVITTVRTGLARAAGTRLCHETGQRVLATWLAPPGIAHLDDPAFGDQMVRDRLTQWHFGMLTRGTQEFTNASISLVAGTAASVVLAGFRWWAPLLLAAMWALTHLWQNTEAEAWERISHEYAPTVRRFSYFHEQALRVEAQKEFRVFGLADWWTDRWAELQATVTRGLRDARPKPWHVLASVAAIVAAIGVVLIAIGRAAASGELELARLAVYVQAALATAGLGHAEWDWWVMTLSIPFPPLEELPDRVRAVGDELAGHRLVPGPPHRSIRFEGVSFSYPGGDEILHGLDLDIEPGRSLAIVGENGAGKTTLIKLLLRMYDPTSGRITVDGLPLDEIDPASWRRHTAVVLQQFTRFPWSLADNIRVGWLGADDEALQAAAHRTGADAVAANLERGWETVPMRTYAGGADLSGGELQRVALARALLATDRGASVLVLDEPTAQLDVRAEAELFDRFLDLTRGLTTMLISHRFSSVRHADRIVVLDHGRIVESGSHDELLAARGLYAGMFELQAKPFREEVTP